MSITAKEIAERLHLSATAVSMALNNKSGVSTETKNRIIHEAELLGYDFSKHTDHKQKHGSIYFIVYFENGVILSYSPIFNELTEGIKKKCHEEGYTVKNLHIHSHSDDLREVLEELRVSDCSGIIFLGTEASVEVCSAFLSLKLPIIFLDTHYQSLNCTSVIIDNIQGAYLATNYLIKQTGELPGHLRSSYKIPNFSERRIGFYNALKENGMSAALSISHELSPTIEGAMYDMLELIDSGVPLAKCYFADNDIIAIGAMRAFQIKGYKIPEDVAFIGFDNITEARVIEPSLTTIDIPRFAMGSMAAYAIIMQIEKGNIPFYKLDVSTKLIKRFSV